MLLSLLLVVAEAAQPSLADLAERRQWDAIAASLADAEVDAAQPDGMTALHWATRHGNAGTVSKLLDAGAAADVRTEYGITPLAIACEAGRVGLVDALLAAGADARNAIPGEQTMLMLAARTGAADVVARLLAAGAEVNATEVSDQTALMWAAAEGHDEVVAALLGAGAAVDARSKNDLSALVFAARHGSLGCCRLLLDAGADVNQTVRPPSTYGRNPRARMAPLLFAVESAHYETALELVRRGADPNDQRSGYAPLHALSFVRRADKGDGVSGDPEPRGSGQVTPLRFVRELVKLGADVDRRLAHGRGGRAILNRKGATPLLLAASTADLPLMQTLVELGADPTAANAVGSTPLLAASGIGVTSLVDEPPGSEAECIAAIDWLLAHGADLHAIDDNGETAMHGAAYRNYPGLVRHLAAIGMRRDVWDAKNRHGTDPMDIARGNRPGAFKPSPETAAAIEEVRRTASPPSAGGGDPADPID